MARVRVRVRVLTKGLESESESLKIWTRVRLEYAVGLECYISAQRVWFSGVGLSIVVQLGCGFH